MPIPADVDLSSMQSRVEDASRLLKALANAQRLRVLCLLVGGEMSVGQINEQLPDLSQSALSQHLAKLRDEDMVSTRREAQTVWYTLPEGPAHVIIAALYAIYCANDSDTSRRLSKPSRRSQAVRKQTRHPG